MPAGWALPGALRCILVLPHPASRHVRAGSALPAPFPRGHRLSPEQGRAARAWTGLRQRRGDTHGGPLPTAPAGVSTPGNEQVRTAAGNTAREEPQRLPRPGQSPQSRFSLSRDIPSSSRRPGRAVQCERAPGEGPTAPSELRDREGGGGDSGGDKGDLGGDKRDPPNDGQLHPQTPRAPAPLRVPCCHSQHGGTGEAASRCHLSPTPALPGDLLGWESTSGHRYGHTWPHSRLCPCKHTQMACRGSHIPTPVPRARQRLPTPNPSAAGP